MLENVLEMFKRPVSYCIQKSEEEEIKTGAIKLAVISLIISLVNVITSVISILTTYTTKNYSYYTAEELAQRRSNAFEDAELISSFFKELIIIAIAIAVVALVLFVIAKIVKSPKEYRSTLSMVTNVLIVYVIGSIVSTILSYIYVPLGLLVSLAAVSFTFFTLIFAFRDSLEIENADLLTIVATATIVVVVIIATILICSIVGISLSNLSSFTSLLRYLS